MRQFQSSVSLWPAPHFLGDSPYGFAAWIIEREAALHLEHEQHKPTIRQIIEQHHDRNGRTIG
jgi:hypothetical protein